MHRSLDRFAKHTQTTFTFMVLHLLFTICTTAHGTHWLHIAQTFHTYIAHIEQSKHCTFTTLQITRICTLDRVNIYYIANHTNIGQSKHLLHCKSHGFAFMALQFQDADYICIPVSASGNLFECSGNYEREYCKN